MDGDVLDAAAKGTAWPRKTSALCGEVDTVTFAISRARLPAYATALGRVLLADRPPEERPDLGEQRALTPRSLMDPVALTAAPETVCAEGYALVDEELKRACVRSPYRSATVRAEWWPP